MRSLLSVLPFVALTFLSWGIYGPVLHEGQYDLGAPLQPSSLRPFICVGISYFAIAVVVPILMLQLRGENGHWTMTGTVWSFAAGAAGAIGALGIIFAFKFRGSPVYVMPLVFGCAPVVNTFVTMWMAGTYKEAGKIFFAGVLLVAIGAAGVMFFKPSSKNISVQEPGDGSITVVLTTVNESGQETTRWTAESLEDLQKQTKAYKLYMKKQPLTAKQMAFIPLSIALTALCWGAYGPVLHRGQMKMAGSRLRPLLCVGLAYFAIAVLVPVPLLKVFAEPGGWDPGGVAWSLAAGAAGAVGALGIILAFNFGGKPIYVMPLVFGFAPVVNTFTTVLSEGTLSHLTPPFFVSLGLVIIGAVTVLVFAPKPGKKSGPPQKPEEAKTPDGSTSRLEDAAANDDEANDAEREESAEETSASAAEE